jgi:hypothetical protein
MTSPANLQWLIDNTPDFETLPFTGVKPKWDASQQAFFDTYKEATVPVLQDGVNYVNPQWMLMGQDLVHVHRQGDACRRCSSSSTLSAPRRRRPPRTRPGRNNDLSSSRQDQWPGRVARLAPAGGRVQLPGFHSTSRV